MKNKSYASTHADWKAALVPLPEGDGAERSIWKLVEGFLTFDRTDMFLCRGKDAYLVEIPAAATTIEMKATSVLQVRWIVAIGNISKLFTFLRPLLLTNKIVRHIARKRSLRPYKEHFSLDALSSALTSANFVSLHAKHKPDFHIPFSVQTGDADGIAQPVQARLKHASPKDLLLRRAEDFSVEVGISNYLALLDAVVTRAASRI
jgi:hypothetical protein